jgi:SPP1 gp7 family putative phage head morphogenesis protein
MIKVPNKEYWIRRSELTLIANEKSALQYEQELKKAYLEAIQKITKEIEAFYGRYAKDNQISLLETRKRLRPDELLNFNKQAKLYLDEVERLGDKAFTEEYREYLKELSSKTYISRLEELTVNIRHNIEKLSTGYNIGLGETLQDAYLDGFYRTMFDIQKQAGFGVSFTTPGGKQLEMAIRERWLAQNYSDRVWADKNKLIIQLEQILSQEFVRGRNPREVSKDFANKMQTSYHNAQRLIRTELNYISNKGSMKAYEESEVVQKYQYLATLDNRTSDICRELDGKIFDLKEAKVGVNLPPLHPHCRSTTIPYFEDNEIEDRVARKDDGAGKSYKLGKDITFFEWVDQYGSPEYKKKVEAQRRKFLEMDRTPRTKKKQTEGGNQNANPS